MNWRNILSHIVGKKAASSESADSLHNDPLIRKWADMQDISVDELCQRVSSLPDSEKPTFSVLEKADSDIVGSYWQSLADFDAIRRTYRSSVALRALDVYSFEKTVVSTTTSFEGFAYLNSVWDRTLAHLHFEGFALPQRILVPENPLYEGFSQNPD